MATTLNTPNVGTKVFLSKLSQVERAMVDNPTKPLGLFEFDSGSITSASTQHQQDDIIYAFTFPDNCRLVDLVYISGDKDSDGSPAIVEDVVLTDTAGSHVVIINDTTVGQAGGTALIDTAKKFVDCSNQKLGVKIVTSAATSQASTIRFKGIVSVGKSGYGLVSFPASVPA